MLVTPNETLRGWLAERGIEGDIELTDAQASQLEALCVQAAAFTHYDEAERQAWAIWTAYTHAGHQPPPRALVAASVPAVAETPQPDLQPLALLEPPPRVTADSVYSWVRWLVPILQALVLIRLYQGGH